MGLKIPTSVSSEQEQDIEIIDQLIESLENERVLIQDVQKHAEDESLQARMKVLHDHKRYLQTELAKAVGQQQQLDEVDTSLLGDLKEWQAKLESVVGDSVQAFLEELNSQQHKTLVQCRNAAQVMNDSQGAQQVETVVAQLETHEQYLKRFLNA